MTVSCPTCGKTTVVEAEVGDFPTHCQCCGGLLRRPNSSGDGLVSACSLRLRWHIPPGGRRERGALADLLTSGPAWDDTPQIIHASRGDKSEDATSTATKRRILRPESRRELAKAHARQQALRRAELRGSHQALGALGVFGIGVVVLLAMSALVLNAQGMWGHGRAERSDVLRASGDIGRDTAVANH